MDSPRRALTALSSLVPRTAPISLRSLRSRLTISADFLLWWDVISCSVENSLWMASRLTWTRRENVTDHGATPGAREHANG